MATPHTGDELVPRAVHGHPGPEPVATIPWARTVVRLPRRPLTGRAS